MVIKQKTEIKLKPCPFCGGKVEFNEINYCNPFGIWCEQCGLEFGIGIHFTSSYQLAKAWNRRATGMVDANNMMIRDGDICRLIFQDDIEGIVRYDNETGMFVFEMEWDVKNFQQIHSKLLKVVGNIYDEPKLLKVRECESEVPE